MRMDAELATDRAFRPTGAFLLRFLRRHIDLARVSSALCPRPHRI